MISIFKRRRGSVFSIRKSSVCAPPLATKKMVGILTEVLPEEIVPLQMFKEAVHDLKQTDSVLLRFLRARNYDVKKAEEMIRYALQWREEIDMKNYQNWEFPPYYKNEMAYQFYGRDFEGAPAMWVMVGKWNGKVLVDNGEGDQLFRWAMAMVERGLKIAEECGSQGHVIVDLDGLTYGQVSHLASMKLFFAGCQKIEQCYPELIKKLFIINAPWVFTIGWNLIKTIVTKRTMEKINIYGCNRNEWMNELLKVFPEESIVPALRKDCNGN